MSSIFPIIRSGCFPRLEEICGTGFLVSKRGHFLTCLHIKEVAPEATYSVALNPDNLNNQTQFELITEKPDKDILLGKFDYSPEDSPLSPGDHVPSRNDVVKIIGFRKEQRVQSHNGAYYPRSIDLRTETAKYLRSRNDLRIAECSPHPARRLSAVFSSGSVPDGFSGAPVLDANGRLIGMHSAAIVERKCHLRFNRGMPFMFHVGIKEIRDAISSYT